MGPSHQKWALRGTVGKVFPSAAFKGETNCMKLRMLIGNAVEFYQLYVFKSYQGVDAYVRRAGARPIDLFWKYHMEVEDPDIWWAAISAQFVRMVNMPEWRDGMAAIMDGGFDRSML